MKRTQLKYLLLMIVFLLPLSIGAIDMGLVVRNKFTYGNDNDYRFYANLVPRISFLFGDTGMVFLSWEYYFYKDNPFEAGDYREENALRFEISGQIGRWFVRAGRMTYTDPLSLITSSLLDGVHMTYSSELGRTSVGAWYKGEEDAVTAIEWEHPSVMDLFSMKVAANGYFNMTDDRDKKDTFLYASFKMGLPVSSLFFEAGGATGTIISPTDTINQMYAGQLGVLWTVPANFSSMLSFTGRYIGGKAKDNNYLVPFTSISEITYGNIFKTKMTAVTILTLDYTARISNPLGATFTASYFMRNDLVTPNIFPIDIVEGRQGKLLGGEIFAQLIWNPFSDLQFILGGGTFLPAMGNVWPNRKALWRVDLTAVLSL